MALKFIGLKEILIGDVAIDGGMGASLASLGGTFRGSAVINQDDGEKTEFFEEENDAPFDSASTTGIKSVEWSIYDFTPSKIVQVLGGTVTGEGDAAVWNAPDTLPSIEQSIRIVSNRGSYMNIVRAKLEAKIEGTFSKKEVVLVRIKATVLAPTKADTPSVVIGKVA